MPKTLGDVPNPWPSAINWDRELGGVAREAMEEEDEFGQAHFCEGMTLARTGFEGFNDHK